jgi:pimeloyl-ACP methyl ester carboxylesterase
MLWGEKDIALSMKTTQGTEEHVEDFTIRYFEGISHHIQQDAPDEVNAMLRAFLANETIPEYLDLKD